MTMTTPGRAVAPAQPAQKRMTLAATTSGVARGPLRILIYGVGGVGKTTFLSEAPSPVFIDTQGGTENLDVRRFPQPQVWTDILDAVDELISTEHDRKTLAIDLLDDVEQMLFAYICKRDGQPNITEYGFGKGFDIAIVEWRVLLSKLERLRNTRGMTIGFVAHSTVKTFKNPEGPDYDRYNLLLNDKGSGFIRGWCDTVLLARHEVVLKTEKKRTRGISTGARVIQTVETAAFYAKNRHNLPDTLALDWTEFSAAVEAGTPASASSLRSEIAELVAQIDEETRGKVNAATASCGDDSTRLVRILNRLREKVQPQQQQLTQESA